MTAQALSAASQGGGGMGATYAGMQGGVIDEETLGFGAMRPDAAFDVDDMS